jgi:glutamyl-Q tRNA(Asp) synthetase
VRIEDLDTPRVVPGSTDSILAALETYALEWDGPVIFQSERLAEYRAAAERLRQAGLTFECSCSRRELSLAGESVYPGTCRDGPRAAGATATRFRVDDGARIAFDDAVQGPCEYALSELGDCVIRRKDGLFSYQLAVVVDDAAQGITDIVRGADLLASTAWQIALQRALGLSTPRYAHLPLVLTHEGEKLAKSRHSLPIEARGASAALTRVLRLLNHAPPAELERASPARLLEWATPLWNPANFRGLRAISADLPPADGSWV